MRVSQVTAEAVGLPVMPVLHSLPGAHELNESGRQSLFQSYGRFFAEFLNEGSLVRLRLLALPTCVGLRYG